METVTVSCLPNRCLARTSKGSRSFAMDPVPLLDARSVTQIRELDASSSQRALLANISVTYISGMI